MSVMQLLLRAIVFVAVPNFHTRKNVQFDKGVSGDSGDNNTLFGHSYEWRVCSQLNTQKVIKHCYINNSGSNTKRTKFFH